jgi:hypothetical protein
VMPLAPSVVYTLLTYRVRQTGWTMWQRGQWHAVLTVFD